MARRPLIFTKQDVTRAIRATMDAGVAVQRVEIDKDGKIVIVIGGSDERLRTEEEELDRELAECEARAWSRST